MTINKAQGHSLQRACLLLHEPVFAHGQLYVALSRAGSFQHVRAFVETSATQGFREEEEEGVEEGTYTNNIVYCDILMEIVSEKTQQVGTSQTLQINRERWLTAILVTSTKKTLYLLKQHQ